MQTFARIFLLLLFSAVNCIAAPLEPKDVPEPLKPWVEWVLPQDSEYFCHFQFNNTNSRFCLWPSLLTIKLTETGGEFSGTWLATQSGELLLPGTKTAFPTNVLINGESAVVTLRDGFPRITISAGTYEVQGQFNWKQLPPSFYIPPETGLLNISVNEQLIDSPKLNHNGELWLRNVAQQSLESNQLDLKVFRRITDAVPMRLMTQLQLNVSGEKREIELGPILPEGFVPLSIQSELSAELNQRGILIVQLKPGVWQISVDARSLEMETELQRPKVLTSWPDSEVWVFDAMPENRVVEVTGVNAIDPQQTQLPDDWKTLPAYLMKAEDQLRMQLIHRGDQQKENNRLVLNRQFWLDFDGKGYTIHDQIRGNVYRDWRLNSQHELALGRVAINEQPQLVTTFNGKEGVELRNSFLRLEADSRYNGDIRELSAVGWDHDFSSLNAELQLPPGWRLIAARGVDDAPGSWWQQWTLLDLFLVLVITIAVGRLWSWYWGILSLLGLILIWKEAEAPKLIWLNLVAVLALMRVLTDAPQVYRFLVWYRKISLVILLLIAIPFAVHEVRIGLFPQLEYYAKRIAPITTPQGNQVLLENMATEMQAEVAAPQALMSQSIKRSKVAVEERFESNQGYSMSENESVGLDPNAKIQTGPGLPEWQWQRQSLRWSGPVEKNQKMSLWLLSPRANLVLNLLRVVLLGLFLFVIFAPNKTQWFKKKPTGSLASWIVGALLITGSFLPEPALAEMPSENMLEQLRTRLTASADCLPQCASVADMAVSIRDNQLRLDLQIHAEKQVAVPLPGEGRWPLTKVMVDGEAAGVLLRNHSGVLYVGLNPGIHQITMMASLGNITQLDLVLPLIPNRFASVDMGDWQVDGVSDDGIPVSPLRFSVIDRKRSEKLLGDDSRLPPFIQVTRSLTLGLEWGMITEVRRISPVGQAIISDIPLLSNESVLTPDVKLDNGKVKLTLPAGQNSTRWESRLLITPELMLEAVNNNVWTEVWKLNISSIWHPEIGGVPMLHQQKNSLWIPEWHPWPGEKVSLKMTRLSGADGSTLTIDQSNVLVKPGNRVTEIIASLAVRSSQGGQHTITLAEGAELQSVSVDSQRQMIRQEGRNVTLPLSPKLQHFEIKIKYPEGITNAYQSPEIDLGVASVNNSTSVTLGANRWLLWVAGPAMGPAILFWGVLAIALVIAIALGSIRMTPLKTHHWLLLMVGLTQIPVAAGMVVVAWLLLLGWHKSEAAAKTTAGFNFRQIFLCLLTVVALATLFSAVQRGLLGSPNVQVGGNLSSARQLNWYADHSEGLLPQVQVYSVPIFIYRLLMLVWSLWLANALLSWLKWGWGCFTYHGIWRKPEFSKNFKQIPQAIKPDKGSSS